jgi:GNAT superfamily N-acetyltransferase
MTFSQSGQRGQPQTATNLLTLRPAVAQDALCVSVLGMQVFLDTYATEGIRESIALAAVEMFAPTTLSAVIADPSTRIIVAQVARHIVGFAQIVGTTDHPLIGCADAAELQRLYVQERFTGQGIGQQLLLRAETCARQLGASRLWATVWAGNDRALGFYPRQGYTHLGTPLYALQNETHANYLFAKML